MLLNYLGHNRQVTNFTLAFFDRKICAKNYSKIEKGI